MSATSIFGKWLEERLEPWMTPDLMILCDGIGQMYQQILELAVEEGEDGTAGYVPAWGKLFEVQVCPFKDLRYLGQYVGVEIPIIATEAEARREIAECESALKRGTLKAIEIAIKKVIGASFFNIQERTSEGGAEAGYHFNVIVETGKASTALREAIEAVIPAGINFSIVEGSGMWLQATKKWEEVAVGKKWPEATGNT